MSRNDHTKPSDYEIFLNKRTDRIYLSKSLETTQLKTTDTDGVVEIKRPFRIVSKVFENEEHHFVREGKELVLRITGQAKQEIVAKFYEDTRGIFTLQIQKYTSSTGNPHNSSFSFVGNEIARLYNFIRNVALLPIEGKEKKTFDDKYLDEIILSKEQHLQLLAKHPEIMQEILKNEITETDIISLGYRKDQLSRFKKLLNDQQYFKLEKAEFQLQRDEDLWQNFFEANNWILGYGLNFIFNTPLEGKKLEQVVHGYSSFGSGKRTDALLKTRGMISSLCFGEIKTHNTPLLKELKKAYRPECWAASDDLSGGVIQIQKSVQKSIENIKTKTQVKAPNGELTGEELFLYQPKSFLVIGSLSQFIGEHGINEDKFSSFELFRKNITNPEIITFDELYERASFILQQPTENEVEIQNI